MSSPTRVLQREGFRNAIGKIPVLRALRHQYGGKSPVAAGTAGATTRRLEKYRDEHLRRFAVYRRPRQRPDGAGDADRTWRMGRPGINRRASVLEELPQLAVRRADDILAATPCPRITHATPSMGRRRRGRRSVAAVRRRCGVRGTPGPADAGRADHRGGAPVRPAAPATATSSSQARSGVESCHDLSGGRSEGSGDARRPAVPIGPVSDQVKLGALLTPLGAVIHDLAGLDVYSGPIQKHSGKIRTVVNMSQLLPHARGENAPKRSATPRHERCPQTVVTGRQQRTWP